MFILCASTPLVIMLVMSLQVKVLNSFNLLEEASLIMSEALTAHPTSVRLWLMKIQGVETSLPSIEGTGTKEHVKELGGMCRKALEQILPKVFHYTLTVTL